AVAVRAQVSMDRGDYRKVIDLVAENLEQFDDTSCLYGIRGGALWYLGELDDAIADFSKGLMFGGPELWAHSSPGQIYAEQEAWDEAMADLNAAVSLAREDGSVEGQAYALNGLGLTLGGLGRFDEALATFAQSLKLCPGNAWAYFNRAKVHRMAGDV